MPLGTCVAVWAVLPPALVGYWYACWPACRLKVTYRREGDDFQLRFCHRFDTDEETFFAFAIPFSYSQTQARVCGSVHGRWRDLTRGPGGLCDFGACPAAPRNRGTWLRTETDT